MSTTNTIVLRPRFQKEIPLPKEQLLTAFDTAKKVNSAIIVTRVDDHVFIKFPKSKQHFWSPQLHLEINEIEGNPTYSKIYGLFGPNPTVWSLFMFVHFIVATLFLGFGVWAYSNWSINNPYKLQIGVMVVLIILWVVLYFIGSLGKNASKEDMLTLHSFMDEVLLKFNY
ncbi:GTP-binding protein [Joostella sp. CR20]|uniref:GTP-binding protein n=1 Tax=Joostella sp. CR20 TaxID=2804312 RepID=UPI00313BF453